MAKLYNTLVVADDFNTLAPGASLSSDPAWTASHNLVPTRDVVETADGERVAYTTGSSASPELYHSTVPASADYGAVVTFGGAAAYTADMGIGASVRLTSPGAGYNCYVGYWRRTSGSWYLRIIRVNGGAATVLYTSPSPITAPVAGDTIRIEATTNGSQVDISLFLNESDVAAATYSDTNAARLTAAGACGIYLFAATASNAPSIARWAMFAAAAATSAAAAFLLNQMRKNQ